MSYKYGFYRFDRGRSVITLKVLKERENFIHIMDKEKKDSKDIEYVMKLIDKTDSINYASERAELLADRAKNNFSKIRFNNSLASEHVKDTIDYMIYRNK